MDIKICRVAVEWKLDRRLENRIDQFQAFSAAEITRQVPHYRHYHHLVTAEEIFINYILAERFNGYASNMSRASVTATWSPSP
jgi:hypothetical protein